MKATHCAVCFAGILGAAIPPVACGNGRSSPGPAEALVKAVCVQRTDGASRQIFRASLAGSDGRTSMLSIRLGAASEQLTLGSIKSLTMARAGMSSDGYQKATLVRNDDRKEEVRVQVGTAKSPLRLTGFSTEGARVNIELAQCGKVTFSTRISEQNTKDHPKE